MKYKFSDAAGNDWGAVRRKEMRSFWKAHYDVMQDGQGDALTMRTSVDRPIVFSEWSPVNGTMLKRRDFAYDQLLDHAHIANLPLKVSEAERREPSGDRQPEGLRPSAYNERNSGNSHYLFRRFNFTPLPMTARFESRFRLRFDRSR